MTGATFSGDGVHVVVVVTEYAMPIERVERASKLVFKSLQRTFPSAQAVKMGLSHSVDLIVGCWRMSFVTLIEREF